MLWHTVLEKAQQRYSGIKQGIFGLLGCNRGLVKLKIICIGYCSYFVDHLMQDCQEHGKIQGERC